MIYTKSEVLYVLVKDCYRLRKGLKATKLYILAIENDSKDIFKAYNYFRYTHV